MENFHNVLVPTDFSPSSWQAVLAGVKVANSGKAKVSILHVTDFKDEKYLDMIKEKLDNLCANLSAIYDLSIEGILKRGFLENTIPDFIKENQVDIVVIGLDDSETSYTSKVSGIIRELNVPVVMVPSSVLDKDISPHH